jgi:hypothetical protein
MTHADSSTALVDVILKGGAGAIHALVLFKREESLHLEFKTITPTKEGKLTRDDRKLLATAICGFSNAEGGLLVVGIGTSKVDGADVASLLQPINNITQVGGYVRSIISEILSPQHVGIFVHVVSEDSEPTTGYLVIAIPPSELRPHMSIADHRYHRRGSAGTRVLEHAEVRELMFALREGRLDVTPEMIVKAYTGDLKFDIDLALTLKNVGRVPVNAPYIKLNQSDWRPVEPEPRMQGRRSVFVSGVYGSRDVLIHVGDELPIALLATGLDFRKTGQIDVLQALAVIEQSGTLESFAMCPKGLMQPMGSVTKDVEIDFAGVYGAENCAAKDFSFKFGKEDFLKMFKEHPHVTSVRK